MLKTCTRYSFHNSLKYNGRIESNVLEQPEVCLTQTEELLPDATVEL